MSHTNGISTLQNLIGSVDLGATRAVSSAKTRTENQVAGAQQGGADRDGDTAVVSSTGSAVAQALASSDVRMDKVSALKQAIDEGSYKVPASAVAGKLLESMLK